MACKCIYIVNNDTKSGWLLSLDIVATIGMIFIMIYRKELCDHTRTRRFDKFKVIFLNAMALGTLVYQTYCLVMRGFSGHGLEITFKVFDLIFYMLRVSDVIAYES